MKIACLCWGSLFWNPEDLNIERDLNNKAVWRHDGPLLPIEFNRKSGNGLITLIIDENAKEVISLWSFMTTDNLDEAFLSLSKRESKNRIGKVDDKNIHKILTIDSGKNKFEKNINVWLKQKNIGAAIWTGYSYKNTKGDEQRMLYPEIKDYLKNIKNKKEAMEYILKAPKQIKTEYRLKIEEEWEEIFGEIFLNKYSS